MGASKADGMYWPDDIVLPRAVEVYTPAVPMRAVEVIRDADGTFFEEEQIVVGVQAVAADHWSHRKIPTGTQPDRPSSPDPADMMAAGYRYAAHLSDCVQHRLLVWQQDTGTIDVLDDSLGEGCVTVTGPATMPAEWWNKKIAAARADLDRRAVEVRS